MIQRQLKLPFKFNTDIDMSGVIRQREEILAAFIAKYGLQPDEIEQVYHTTRDGWTYYVRKRTKIDRRKKHV